MKGCDKCHPWAPKSLDDSLLKDLKIVDSFICICLWMHLHDLPAVLQDKGIIAIAMAMARTAIFMMLRTNGDFKLL